MPRPTFRMRLGSSVKSNLRHGIIRNLSVNPCGKSPVTHCLIIRNKSSNFAHTILLDCCFATRCQHLYMHGRVLYTHQRSLEFSHRHYSQRTSFPTTSGPVSSSVPNPKHRYPSLYDFLCPRHDCVVAMQMTWA
jgi:hypothetical protein